MAEWLYEAGIGEARAALIENDRIVEAWIEPDDAGPRLGAVHDAQLTDLRAGLATLDTGHAVQLAAPARVTQGAKLRVEIVREIIPEPGRTKPARATPTEAELSPGPALLDRIIAGGLAVRHVRAHEADTLEAAGWSEVLDEATTGDIIFPDGALRMSPTPAMTLFDVDGGAPLEALALRAAVAVAATIRRHGIGGPIGIDFPTLQGKAQRLAIAEAIDAHLAPPFERTAMNGFGFLQIVRPRPRASLPERLRGDPNGAAARAALRVAERTPPGAPQVHRVDAAVEKRIRSRPDWTAELMRRTGRTPIFEG